MTEAVVIRPMLAQDAIAIERQPSQRVQLGIDMTGAMTLELAQSMIDGGEAWTAEQSGRIVAIMGLRETFPGVQGVAWAVLAPGIGAAHLAVSRHARRRIADSPLRRIEAVVEAAVDAEAILLTFPGLDPGQLLEAVISVKGPQIAWARSVGLTPAHVLRRFGGRSETHVLFERIA
jgi:hypothetical protein